MIHSRSFGFLSSLSSFRFVIPAAAIFVMYACGTSTEDETSGDGDGDGDTPVNPLDTNNDGVADDLGSTIDADGDGNPDPFDINLDGTPDGIGVDTNQDGIADAIGIDTNADGILDAIDKDGDGVPDETTTVLPGGTGGSGSGGTGSGGTATGGSPSSGGPVPGTEGYDCTPASGSVGSLLLTQVGSGYTRPIGLAHAPSDPRLFVLEHGGLIKIVGGGTFLDLSAKSFSVVEVWEERGLLGMAFHPSYATNGLFYVHYSAKDTGNTTVEEYKATGNVADPNSGRVILSVNQNYENHKGGSLEFGGDGYLYLALGDNGSAPSTLGGDPDGNGQDLLALPGKILRIDPATGDGAPGNYPGAAPEVWDIGLRNPFRMNFDACNGDLYIGDVGQELFEEINIEKAGEGHKNYGWNTMEGDTCFNANDKINPLPTCNKAGLTGPVLTYPNGGGAALVGGSVYRGSTIPALRGTYFYTDQIKNTVWSLVYNRETGAITGPTTHNTLSVNSITAIENDADGELYFVSMLGTVSKLTAL